MVYVMLGVEAREHCMLSILLAELHRQLRASCYSVSLHTMQFSPHECTIAQAKVWGLRGWSGPSASVCWRVLSVGTSPIVYPLLFLGSTVHPECSEEGTNTPRQTSQGDGASQFDHGESRKVQYGHAIQSTAFPSP